MIEDKIEQYLNEGIFNSNNPSIKTLIQKINFNEKTKCCGNCRSFNKIEKLCMNDNVLEIFDTLDLTFFSTNEYSVCKFYKG